MANVCGAFSITNMLEILLWNFVCCFPYFLYSLIGM